MKKKKKKIAKNYNNRPNETMDKERQTLPSPEQQKMCRLARKNQNRGFKIGSLWDIGSKSINRNGFEKASNARRPGKK